jgi:hypothetical protein
MTLHSPAMRTSSFALEGGPSLPPLLLPTKEVVSAAADGFASSTGASAAARTCSSGAARAPPTGPLGRARRHSGHVACPRRACACTWLVKHGLSKTCAQRVTTASEIESRQTQQSSPAACARASSRRSTSSRERAPAPDAGGVLPVGPRDEAAPPPGRAATSAATRAVRSAGTSEAWQASWRIRKMSSRMDAECCRATSGLTRRSSACKYAGKRTGP